MTTDDRGTDPGTTPVAGKDDLQRSQAIEPTCARRYTLGHTAQEVRQHQRVHILPHV